MWRGDEPGLTGAGGEELDRDAIHTYISSYIHTCTFIQRHNRANESEASEREDSEKRKVQREMEKCSSSSSRSSELVSAGLGHVICQQTVRCRRGTMHQHTITGRAAGPAGSLVLGQWTAFDSISYYGSRYRL